MSPTVFNNSLAALRKLLEVGIKAGLRTTNPITGIKCVRLSKKELSNKLPSQLQFRSSVDEIRRGKSRWAPHCADLVEFLAYSGLRLEEEKWVLWKHCEKIGPNSETKLASIGGIGPELKGAVEGVAVELSTRPERPSSNQEI